MFKKITALLLGAAIMAASSSVAFAEDAPQIQTVSVQQELGASAVKTWDGKSALEAGKSYVLKKSVTLSKKVEIPKGTTLTLNKGVKLGIGAKGSLYIRGTLAMKAGSTLSVSGKLYTYSGSKISDSGAIKLNTNKAAVTIGGNLTVNKTGTISGTPKSIKIGKNGKVTIKGKNTCEKLAKLLKTTSSSDLEKDKKAISEKLTAIMNKVLVDDDYYSGIAMAYPDEIMKKAEEELKAMIKENDTTGEYADLTLKDFYNMLYESFFKPAFDELGDIKNVTITVTSLKDCLKDLTDEEKTFFDGCGKITKAYDADIKGDMEFADGTHADPSADPSEFPMSSTVRVYCIDGEWYLSGVNGTF